MGFSDLGKKLSKLGQDTKNGVQKVSDSVTISNRISQEKKSLERLFAMIGEAVYKEQPDTPKAGLEDEWAAVKVAYSNIASYTEQLNNIKGLVYCPNCGRPAASGDKFCARCGFRLNIRPETTGEKMAKDLKEAGKEVGRIAGDAADKTGEAVGGAAAGTKNAFSWLKGKLRRQKAETVGDNPEEKDTRTEISPEEVPVNQAAEEAAEVLRDEISADAAAAEEAYETLQAGDQPVSETAEETDGLLPDEDNEAAYPEEEETFSDEELSDEEFSADDHADTMTVESAGAGQVFARRQGSSRRNRRKGWQKK